MAKVYPIDPVIVTIPKSGTVTVPKGTPIVLDPIEVVTPLPKEIAPTPVPAPVAEFPTWAKVAVIGVGVWVLGRFL